MLRDALIGAIVGGSISSIITFWGWRRSNKITILKNRQDYRRKQIDEFYGPLLGLIKYSQVVYDIAEQKLPNANGHIDFDSFNKSKSDVEHSKIWDYLNDNYFVDINSKIAELLNQKQYLIESQELKDLTLEFLEHEAQGNCLHRLWRDLKESSKEIKNEGWPINFENLVKNDFKFIENEYKRISKT
jgi:hypothetical protein